jgi:hypothetical protein
MNALGTCQICKKPVYTDGLLINNPYPVDKYDLFLLVHESCYNKRFAIKKLRPIIIR